MFLCFKETRDSLDSAVKTLCNACETLHSGEQGADILSSPWSFYAFRWTALPSWCTISRAAFALKIPCAIETKLTTHIDSHNESMYVVCKVNTFWIGFRGFFFMSKLWQYLSFSRVVTPCSFSSAGPKSKHKQIKANTTTVNQAHLLQLDNIHK
jgi:hypothetical protein